MRNKTNNLYRRLRNSHFKERLLLYRTSPRQLWTTIKYITNKQRLPLQVPVPLNDLSRYFERLLQQPGEYITLPYGPNNINSLQTFVPVTPTEIEGLPSQLNPRKSPGPDMISPLELKMVKQQISTQLSTSIIFNESLATGVLPAEFKTGNISPILKPGKTDNSALNSYRGISLTCVLAKVLEKIVHQQLEAHFHKIGAYHEDQYGFRKGRSCADLLLATIDDWLIAKDHKKSTSIVFIDLSKAFDNVRHDKLLIKLQKLGVSGTVLKWIHNFLRNRMQKVVVGSRSSPSFYCTKGVPQGSVLSPLLFNIYVSDLHSVAKENNSSLRSFADDMTLYHSDTSAEQASKTVCAALNIINGELVDLGLPINVEKSAALLICPSAKKSNHLPSTPPILLCRTPVNVVTEMRLLGVIVDNQLSWSSQVNSVISKVSQKIGILRRNIHQLSPSARRLFYLAVIQPDLEYAATATIPFMSTSLRDRLCSVWRRAVRCVAGADWQAEVAPILKNHRLTSIEHRWALQFAVVVRRCVQKSAPLSLCTRLSFTEHSHQTRGSGNSLQPFCPSSRPGMLSFTNRAPLVWNSLPASIKQAQTMNFFKSEYLKHLSNSSNSLKQLKLTLGDPV